MGKKTIYLDYKNPKIKKLAFSLAILIHIGLLLYMNNLELGNKKLLAKKTDVNVSVISSPYRILMDSRQNSNVIINNKSTNDHNIPNVISNKQNITIPPINKIKPNAKKNTKNIAKLSSITKMKESNYSTIKNTQKLPNIAATINNDINNNNDINDINSTNKDKDSDSQDYNESANANNNNEGDPNILPINSVENSGDNSTTGINPATVQGDESFQERDGNKLPVYSTLDRMLGRQGNVTFIYHINEDGKTTQINMIKSSGHTSLDKEALRSLKNWRYLPGQSGIAKKTFSFSLKSQANTQTKN